MASVRRAPYGRLVDDNQHAFAVVTAPRDWIARKLGNYGRTSLHRAIQLRCRIVERYVAERRLS